MTLKALRELCVSGFPESKLFMKPPLVLIPLITRHWLRVGERPPMLKLTAILQYFANVVGQRVNTVRFANLTAADYVLDL